MMWCGNTAAHHRSAEQSSTVRSCVCHLPKSRHKHTNATHMLMWILRSRYAYVCTHIQQQKLYFLFFVAVVNAKDNRGTEGGLSKQTRSTRLSGGWRDISRFGKISSGLASRCVHEDFCTTVPRERFTPDHLTFNTKLYSHDERQ